MSIGSKFRLALAGLTAAALIGGVMVADPADAGKKKHKKVKVVKKKKVKKVKKGDSVKQVSKGGDAKAGNGGNGGSGGSSGNVYNTGNVGGGAGDALGSCLLELLPITVGDLDEAALDAAGCDFASPQEAQDLMVCLRLQADANQVIQESAALACGAVLPGSGGSVFSGDAGSGAVGGNGGNATGGAGGDNSNTSTVTVNRDDHSIDVNA